MEVILLWLDELDDLVSTFALTWRSFCRCALGPGLGAAWVLTPLSSAEPGANAFAAFSALALGSVCAWLLAVVTSARPRLQSVTATA